MSHNSPPPLTILYKHTDFIVVDKPAGISTHASPGDTADNVVDMLKGRYGALHPISRLDNGTSGLLVIALKVEAATNIELVQKSYVAQVFGVTPVCGVIEKELVTKSFGRGEKKRQTALSRYHRISHDTENSCVLIHIETGRHHQIRKHLRSIGHPIVGDFRHGYKDKNLAYQETLGKRLRMMLHCSGVRLVYKKKVHRFKSTPTV